MSNPAPSYHSSASWRHEYRLHLNIGGVLSLGLLLVATNLNWSIGTMAPAEPPPEETMTIEDVTVTRHAKTPPPPPLVPVEVPEEVPDDKIIEQDEPPNFDPLVTDPVDERPPSMPPEPEDGEDEADYFEVVENPPQIKGGMQALYDAVEYPRRARNAGIEGRVVVQFVVTPDGTVRDATILRGVNPLLNEAALEAVRKTTFLPRRQRGVAVPVQMSLPVTFRLR